MAQKDILQQLAHAKGQAIQQVGGIQTKENTDVVDAITKSLFENKTGSSPNWEKSSAFTSMFDSKPVKTTYSEAEKRRVANPKTDTRTAEQKMNAAQRALNIHNAAQGENKPVEKTPLQKAMDAVFQQPAGTSVSDAPVQMDKSLQQPDQDARRKELEATVEHYRQQMQAEEDRTVMDADMAEFNSWPEEDREALKTYIIQDAQEKNNPFSTPSLYSARYNATNLFNKYGAQKVKEMAESYRRSENEKTAQEVAQIGRESAGDSWEDIFSGAAANVATVGLNLVGNLASPLGYLQEATERTGRYSTMDANNVGNLLNTYSGAVRQQTAQNIAGDTYDENGNLVQDGGTGRQLLSYGYQGLMSAADSIARAAVGGGSKAISLGLAGLGSWGQTMSQASAQGATPAQAALLATANAGIEVATEFLPLDELLKTAKGGVGKVMPVLVSVMKQAGIEATTEEISLLGTLIAEAAFLQEKSSYNQTINALVAQGATIEEATAQANAQVWQEAKDTAVISALSGGMSGFGSGLKGAKAQAQQAVDAMEAQKAAQTAEGAEAAQTQPAAETQAQPQTEAAAQPATQEKSLVDEAGEYLAKDMPKTEPEPRNERQRVLDEAFSAVLNNVSQKMQTAENGASNRMAEEVMNDSAALQQLIQQTGAEIAGTKAEQRRAVKDALNRMFDKTVEKKEYRDRLIPAKKGTGAAEQNFTGKAAYQDLLYEGNVQRDRPTDVRPMEVPKTDSYGRNVSEAVGNAYGAGITPDSMANEIEMLVQEGALGFDTRTNKESLEEAAKSIKEKGAAATRTRITRAVANGKIADGDIEQAMLLYAKYANDPKRQDDASEMMVDLATMANITGRNLQLFRLLRQMTPEGMAMVLQKEVNRSVEKLQKAGKVKKGFSSSVDPQLMDDYIAAVKENKSKNTPETEQRVKDAQNAIYAAEAAKVPSSLKAKWDAWRYMAMLGNAKTQVRNVAGNVAFMPYKEVKDKMAAAAERVFLPQEKRTKSLTTDRELVEWAKRDAKSDYVQNSLKYSAKLGDDVTNSKIQENVKVFDNKALESVRKFVEKLPAGADLLFKNGYYERSLAGFLSARGYTASDMVNGKVSEAILNEGRSYAIQEAMKATFNDSNSFSDFFAGLRYKGENPVGKAANLIAEGVLPFRRTPANIVVRFTEYSPVGLAKGAWDMATKVRNGDLSAAAAIDQIASGMTGTAALALGYFLASGIAGVKLTGSGSDEDEKRQGHQDYALEFSVDGQEYSYKIDWAAPANLPLFVGANIHNAIENAGGDADVSKLTSFIRGFATMFEPMLALSCLSSLNDLVEGVRYAEDGEALYTLAADTATSYLTQAIPALARQAAQAIPENKQMTFVNDEDPTIKDLKQTAANIPGVGAAFQTDRINAWGEKESQGNWMDRAFNSFVNPGTLKKIDSGELEKEISRLNELPGVNVSPPTAGKKISYTDTDGEKHERPLTEEEYQTLATTQGQTAKAMIGQMIKSKDYQTMDDDQKAKAIEQVYSYAKTYAETKAIEDHTGFDESWMMEIDEPTSEQAVKKGTDYIMRRVTKSELTNAFTALDTAWDKGYKDSGRADDLKWAYDVFAAMTPAAKADVKEWLSGDSAKYVEAREKGVTHEQFLSAAKNVNAAKGTGKGGTVKDIDKRQAIAKTAGMPDAVIDKIMKAYMGDYDPEDSSSEKTELKYDYIRHGMGLSPEQYAETYRAYLDNDKKAEKVAAIMDLGYSQSVATTLYNVYYGNTSGKNAYMSYYEKNR